MTGEPGAGLPGPVAQPGPAGGAVYPAVDQHEVSLLELANALLRRYRLVFGLPLGMAVLTAVLSLIVPVTYTATASFVAESGSQQGVSPGLASLAGQFGVSLGGEEQMPRFYAEVLKSRGLMDRVLLARYPDPRRKHNPADSVTLLAILKVKGDNRADSLHRGRKKLADLVSTRVDVQTGIVTLRVDSRYPELAAQVAKEFLAGLNEFNAQTRQTQAGARRRFVEGRVAEAERDLRQAEDDLKAFYERNRSWQQAPQLVVEEDRLRRQVQIRQEVYVTLRREYETARIEEVNDTPVITVVEQPIPPQEKSKPRRALLVVLAFVATGMASVVGAFAAEYFDRARREEGQEYREFQALMLRLRTELERVVGPMLALGRRVLRRWSRPS